MLFRRRLPVSSLRDRIPHTSAGIGHSFELRLPASRMRATLPIVGAPMQWFLRVFPFMNGWSIYLDPRTKFIVYARKRASG